MIFMLAILPATALTIAGYLVLYVAGRSEGNFKSFGKYLGFWAFTLAGLVLLAALFAAARHGDRMRGPGRVSTRIERRLEMPAPPPGAPAPSEPAGPPPSSAVPPPPPAGK